MNEKERKSKGRGNLEQENEGQFLGVQGPIQNSGFINFVKQHPRCVILLHKLGKNRNQKNKTQT